MGVAIKIAVLVSWRTAPCLFDNLIICSLRLKKGILFLKMLLCFRFCAFGFAAIPHPSCYLTSVVDKTCRGPVIAPFSLQLFSYAGGVPGIK